MIIETADHPDHGGHALATAKPEPHGIDIILLHGCFPRSPGFGEFGRARCVEPLTSRALRLTRSSGRQRARRQSALAGEVLYRPSAAAIRW
jgi:hypothetical protein